MNTPQMTRDGFMPVGAFGNPGSTGVGRTDNFDIERVEVIMGPQSLLYGGGAGAGGAINVSSKMARFGREGLLRSAKGSLLYRSRSIRFEARRTRFRRRQQLVCGAVRVFERETPGAAA